MAILPREVAVAAPNWQNGLPAPLARDRGAPRTQRGHPDSRVALSSRLDQVSLRCWLDTSPPRRRDAPHAHDAGAERARGVRVGLSTSYSAPSCLSLLGLFTWGQCSAASGRPAHYHALRAARRASARALRARRGGAGRPHGPYPPPTDPRSPHRATPLSRKRSLHPCTPPHGVTRPPRRRHHPTPRHDDAREVHAGRSWGGRAVRGDRPRSQGHRLGRCFRLPAGMRQIHCLSPLSNIPAARARGRAVPGRVRLAPRSERSIELAVHPR